MIRAYLSFLKGNSSPTSTHLLTLVHFWIWLPWYGRKLWARRKRPILSSWVALLGQLLLTECLHDFLFQDTSPERFQPISAPIASSLLLIDGAEIIDARHTSLVVAHRLFIAVHIHWVYQIHPMEIPTWLTAPAACLSLIWNYISLFPQRMSTHPPPGDYYLAVMLDHFP